MESILAKDEIGGSIHEEKAMEYIGEVAESLSM